MQFSAAILLGFSTLAAATWNYTGTAYPTATGTGYLMPTGTLAARTYLMPKLKPITARDASSDAMASRSGVVGFGAVLVAAAGVVIAIWESLFNGHGRIRWRTHELNIYIHTVTSNGSGGGGGFMNWTTTMTMTTMHAEHTTLLTMMMMNARWTD
jgi:hypothetical protein